MSDESIWRQGSWSTVVVQDLSSRCVEHVSFVFVYPAQAAQPSAHVPLHSHGEGDDEYPDQMTLSFCLISYQQVRKTCDCRFWIATGTQARHFPTPNTSANSTSLSSLSDIINSLHGPNSLATPLSLGLGTRTGTTWEGIDAY